MCMLFVYVFYAAQLRAIMSTNFNIYKASNICEMSLAEMTEYQRSMSLADRIQKRK